MRSMTGYGRGQSHHGGTKFSVELHSVNRKQSDVVVNIPREIAQLEPRVRDVINAEVTRGRLNVAIACHRGDGAAVAVVLDTKLARVYYQAMLELQAELGAGGEVSIETILRAPGVLRPPEETVDPEECWPFIEQALKDGLRDLVGMRVREGRHLARDLIRRLKTVRNVAKRIRTMQPGVAKRYRQLLHERVQRAGLDLPIDDDRLAKEVVVFAERCDITEELTRLDSHLIQFAHHMRKAEPVGRTMEFICQEMARELNTLGAKANDADILHLVVECKAEVEKIREQLSNIE